MRTTILMTSVLALATIFAVGCSETNTEQSQAETANSDEHDHDKHASTEKGGVGDDHSEWWCNEHGLPEEVCSMCSAKVAADFQKKGDWCKEHERAESQCFRCHPELESKFAAQYEAKYGKKPPTPEG